MKKYGIIMVACVAIVSLLSSCASTTTTLQKDIKHMTIRFKPLTRNDINLVGNLEASATISYKIGKTGKELDKPYRKDTKEGLITASEATEVLYFAPGSGESITGSLYENEIFNTVFGSRNISGQNTPKGCGGSNGCDALFPGIKAFFGKFKVKMADPGMAFAYYAIVEKYPDVDYFINVRFERKTVNDGSKITETVTVKSDGVKLKTD